MLQQSNILEGLRPFAALDGGYLSRRGRQCLHLGTCLVIDMSSMFISGKIQ